MSQITSQTNTEFNNLKTKLMEILHNPQYLSYHLHITFEINFDHLFQQEDKNNDNATSPIALTSEIKKKKIYNLIKHLETNFGLNNFTIISLPLSNNTSYIQYLTTCKFNTSPIDASVTEFNQENYQVFSYFNALYQLQQTNLINAVGFKIEGVVFPSKKPLFVQQIERNPSVSPVDLKKEHPEFCYFETHRKVPTLAGLKLQPNELVSYSFKNQCYMSAFREYNITTIPQGLAKYEVCIYETWIKDIEKDWKVAHITDGDFVVGTSSSVPQHQDPTESNAEYNIYNHDLYNELFIKTLELVQIEAGAD